MNLDLILFYFTIHLSTRLLASANSSLFNPLTTNVPIIICSANQLTAFYMMGALVVKGLINIKRGKIRRAELAAS